MSSQKVQGVNESVEKMLSASFKRTYELFKHDGRDGVAYLDAPFLGSTGVHKTSKTTYEYKLVKDLPNNNHSGRTKKKSRRQPKAEARAKKIENKPAAALAAPSTELTVHRPEQAADAVSAFNKRTNTEEVKSLAVALRRPNRSQRAEPTWHPQWKLMRVISGHLGWVRSVAVEHGNEWFATGSADRTIKIWDLASGTLKLTLTGHINTVRGLVVSPRHPYLFSVSDDKTVKCWDLETNQVVRHYHGHLSGVYSVALHPTLDVLVTGARDSSARVWDMRTKKQIHILGGHDGSVNTVACQGADPQVVTGSADSTIRLWDLATGKTMTTLTNHKKGVRAMALHPTEFTFASASADNIKKWKFPEGRFMDNFQGHDTIVNCLSLNHDGVMVSGGDDGILKFWDWKSGNVFQSTKTINQPGSLAGEAAIFASTFDQSGSRLITCEGDKTIKIWREDEMSTKETHPVVFDRDEMRKRY
jgi:pleiotropic regulator 1|eukprot:g5808.t1